MNSSFDHPKWKNITISGAVATGATTLAKLMAEKLNWKLVVGGKLVREYVKKRGIPLEKTTLTPDKYHQNLDNFIKEKLKKEKHLIIESWLAGFDAKDIENVYKILVICSDKKSRIQRLVVRDEISLQVAKELLETREKENLIKWEKLYKTKDFWNPENYNLVIDTAKKEQKQTLKRALKGVGFIE